MSISRRYKVLWVAFIVFLGMNVWLLYGKIHLEQQVDILQAKSIKKSGSVSNLTEAVHFLPLNSDNGKVREPLRLVAIFTDYGCPHCTKTEVGYLNQWEKNFPHSLRVYLINTSKSYIKSYGATFSYNNIKSANKLFSVSLPSGNPLVVLVDQKGNVQDIHTNDLTRPGSDQRRAAFYERMYSLFRSVYGE